MSDTRLIRLFFSANFILVALLYSSLLRADYFQVDPEMDPWKERLCMLYNIPAKPICETVGGTWLGTNNNPPCSILDYEEQFNSLPLVDRVTGYIVNGRNWCEMPTVTFTGWGYPPSPACWNHTVKYSLGVEIWTTGIFSASGVKEPNCTVPDQEEVTALRTRDVRCPAGAGIQGTGDDRRCYVYCPDPQVLRNGICVNPPGKDDGKACGVGNPCIPSTGNKYQSETDFSNGGLSFTRSYNSLNLAHLGLGQGWRSNHQKKLIVATASLTLVSGTGRGEPWIKVGGVWQGDADSDVLITEDAAGFQLTNAKGVIEAYSLTGQLLSQTDTNGHQTSFSYNGNSQLTQVTTHYGYSIGFEYANENLASVTDIFGAVYSYEYDTQDNLVKVIYPDTTPSDNTDNPRKTYHYENANYPNHLTGITDENGDRYATWAYNADGKAISTEHSQTTNSVGQEKFELDYQ